MLVPDRLVSRRYQKRDGDGERHARQLASALKKALAFAPLLLFCFLGESPTGSSFEPKATPAVNPSRIAANTTPMDRKKPLQRRCRSARVPYAAVTQIIKLSGSNPSDKNCGRGSHGHAQRQVRV